MLIHEAVDPEALRKLAPSERLVQAIVAHHTTPAQAADIFNRVMPRLAVFSHTPGSAAIVATTQKSYTGQVVMGEDLMVIDIGDKVRLRHLLTDMPPR